MKSPKKHAKYGDYETIVHFPVFALYQIHVVFTTDIEKSNIKRYGTFNAGGCDACHRSAHNGHAHIFFKLGNCPYGVVAHESWHAIRSMLVDFAGVEIMENEVTAYHLGYLVQEIFEYRNALIDAGIGVPTPDIKSIQLEELVAGITPGNQHNEIVVKSSTKKRKNNAGQRSGTRGQKTTG